MVGSYCFRCGQRHADILRPVRTLLREIASDVLTLDNRLLRTLRLLLSRPGFLTNEYLAGHRSRYVRPFRLYVAASVVYFLVQEVSQSTRFFVFYYSGGDDPQFAGFRSLVELLPRLMFLFLPAFALMLKAVYPSRLFIEHLVFAFHYHAFAFLAFAVESALDGVLGARIPATDFGLLGAALVVLELALDIAIIVYLMFAVQRVYRSGWLSTVVKGFGTLILYCAVIGAVVLVVLQLGLGA